MAIYYLILGLILNFFVTNSISIILRKYALVEPVNRSSHNIAKPTGGGISFVLVTFFSVLFVKLIIHHNLVFLDYLVLISTILALVGLADDFFDLPRIFRFLTQFLAVIGILITSNFIDINNLFFLIVCFIGVSIINFVNFMDGIDGLVLGSFLVIFIGLTFYYNLDPIIWTLIGGMSVLLFYNWCPSKIFMGDVGSLFIGSVMFGLCLSSNNFEGFVRVLLLGSPIFIDAITCLFKRKFAGQNIFEPHKKHLYQRLVQAGLSHSKVSTIYITSIIFLTLINNFLTLNYLFIGATLIFIIGVWMDKRFAVKFE